MASSSVSVETSNLTILHPNIKLVINKSELCPICLGDFVSNKNIVVPDCGHSMHIQCFSTLLSYNLIHCSICHKQVIDKKEVCVSNRSMRVPTPAPTSGRRTIGVPTPSPPSRRPVHTVYPSDYERVIHGDGSGISPWG